MKTLLKYVIFSRIFCFAVLSVFSLDIILGGMISQWLVLTPKSISQNFEFWRLITFPFAVNTVSGVFLFGFTFWIISPKIEKVLANRVYPLVLLLLVLLQGIISTIVFWNSSIAFSGPEGISIFVFTLFILLERKRRVIVLSIRPFRLEYLFVMMLIMWISMVSLQAVVQKSFVLVINNGTSALFGLTSGIIVYLQMQLIRNYKKLRQYEKQAYEMPSPEELSMAIAHKFSSKPARNLKPAESFGNPDEYYTEDRLNAILDKMIESGKEALSEEEQLFLKEYSEFLKL